MALKSWLAAVAGLPRVQRLWTDIFDHFAFDVWVTPTTPVPTTLINETEPYTFLNGRLISHADAACRYNGIDPPIAVPSISLPAGVTASGLPIGLQLQARPGVPWRAGRCRSHALWHIVLHVAD